VIERLLAAVLVAAFEVYHDEANINCTDPRLIHAAMLLHAFACGRIDE